MRRLPLFEPTAPSPERRETLPAEKLARAFMRQSYPLSPLGEQLRAAVGEVLERGDRERDLAQIARLLPTVEHPRPELFADLNLSEEAKDRIFYTSDLANIQITKGCSHGCDFCSVSAEKTIQQMPFPALVKIAETKQHANNLLREEHQRLLHELHDQIEAIQETCWNFIRECSVKNPQLAGDIALHRWGPYNTTSPTDILLYNIPNTLRGYYYDRHITSPEGRQFTQWYKEIIHDVTEYIKKHHPILMRFYDTSINPMAEENHTDHVPMYTQNPSLLRLFRKNVGLRAVCLYYDSDPFDYKDSSFLHEDGTPADVGDVFNLLTTPEQPIHFTTAGWTRKNTHAQRAARKLVETVKQRGGNLLRGMRISVNATERRAKQHLDEYCEDMKAVIDILAPLVPELLLMVPAHLSLDDYEQYMARVHKPLARYAQQLTDDGKKIVVMQPHTTYRNGGATSLSINPAFVDKALNHDNGACMPGWHIHPSGEIAYQKPGRTPGSAELDARPESSGHFLFTKNQSS